MSVASKQYNDITEELQKNFEKHDFISIVATNVNGNEEFQVTYNVNGLVEDENGNISIQKSHTIMLSIPFGFPLFAPNCKPVTPIFHPDFDPGAICLGDFWNQDRTCTELVEFISHMIVGEVYSLENAFNEKAARYYFEHSDDLPFPYGDGSTPQPRKTVIAEPIKEDDNFSALFESYSLERDDFPEEIVDQAPPEYDIEALEALAAKKAFYQLDRELNLIPISTNFPQRETFRRQIDEAFDRAQKFQKQGADFENEGEFEDAKKAYTKSLATVSDFYGARESLERVQQALLFGNKKKHDEPIATVDVAKEKADEEPKPHKNRAKKLPAASHLAKRYMPLALTGVACIGLACVLANTFEKYSFVQHVSDNFSRCQSAFEKKEFHSAKTICESVATNGGSGGLFFGGQLEELQAKAQNILQSEDLVQGLAGKVKVNGIWVNKEQVENTSVFASLIDKVEEVVEEENWIEAGEALRQASALAETADEKAKIEATKKLLDFKKSRQKALFIHKEQGCKGSEEHFLTAMEKAKILPKSSRETSMDEIDSYLTECTFYDLVSEGNKYYNDAEWENALPLYRDALAKMKESGLKTDLAVGDLEQKLQKSSLYSALNGANSAFAAGAWDDAISQYKNALNLMDDEGENSGQMSRQKIERIILQAGIIKAKQESAHFHARKNFDKAIAWQGEIIRLIDESRFKSEADFTTAKISATENISKFKSEKYIEAKRQELSRKQLAIFLENYPSAYPESLKDLAIELVGEKGNLITYKMMATETSKGRPLTLVIYYAYNKNSGRWQFAQTPVQNNQ